MAAYGGGFGVYAIPTAAIPTTAIPTAAIPVSVECLILGRKFPQRQDAELPLKLNDLF